MVDKIVDASRILGEPYSKVENNIHVFAGFPNVRKAIDVFRDNPESIVVFVMTTWEKRDPTGYLIRNCNVDTQLHQIKHCERKLFDKTRVIQMSMPVTYKGTMQDLLDQVRDMYLHQFNCTQFWTPTESPSVFGTLVDVQNKARDSISAAMGIPERLLRNNINPTRVVN